MDILNALVKHYDAMAAAGNATPFGWTHKFAQYAVELNDDGEIDRIFALGDLSDKKNKGEEFKMPTRRPRSGKLPIPYVFCDDAEHLLGKVGEASNLVRYTMMRDAVFMLRDLLGHSKALDVVYKFYETWDPEKALDNKCVSDVMEAKGQEKKTFILNVLHNEESQFNKTIDQGLKILADLEAEMKEAGKSVLGGSDAFRLYDTYGFPIDLTKEILEEKGYTIDEDGFKEEMEVQRKRARESRAVSNYMGADATVYDEIDRNITTEFDGYDKLEAASKVTVLTTETEIVDSLMEGQKGTIFVEKTPFYATMGGQEGDTGVITTANGVFRVEDTIKLRGGKYGHVGVMESGMISGGEEVTLKVDEQERKDTCKNHSATHLLQKALKTVLGAHVEQKGSLVNPTRLRFDFAHFQAMTPEEIAETEALVNKEIQAALPVTTQIMGIEEAKKTGAMALFGEKYGDEVRVVSMGDFSVEL